MASNTQEETKPDGAAFDQFFDSIGKKAENLTINQDSKPATNSTESTSLASEEKADDEPKVVDEIESLCMNCHENVCVPINPKPICSDLHLRELHAFSLLESPSFAKSY